MIIDAPAQSITVEPRPSNTVTPEVLEAISAYPAANVGDALGRFGLMDSNIQVRAAITSTYVGPALTVLTREGDNLAIHRALDEAEPGDFLVVCGGRDHNRALFGDLLAEVAIARGVRGVILDGALRDRSSVEELGLPVWSASVTPAGPTKTGPGKVSIPIACGGVVVHPGDVIVADNDGVAVVPAAEAAQVAERLRAIETLEDGMRARARAMTA